MAFRIPNFNLKCNIWTGGVFPLTAAPSGAPRAGNVACALVYGERVNVASTGGTSTQGFPLQTMNLLVPKGTDIRGVQDSTGNIDAVECPAGSGRFYQVFFVDDIGKGWANEHRSAGLAIIQGTWVAPYQ